MRKQGSWEVGDVVRLLNSELSVTAEPVHLHWMCFWGICILHLVASSNLPTPKGWGAFVHLGRGHSAVMFTSRTKIQNCTIIWLQSFWFYSLSTLYTATTHMIIAWNYRVPRVIRQWKLHDAMLYLLTCVIAVCASRSRMDVLIGHVCGGRTNNWMVKLFVWGYDVIKWPLIP